MNVALVGARGTGKSTIAALLGERLGWPVRSTDRRIEELAGRTIAAIVEAEGWGRFRELEEEAVAEAARLDRHVLDTGGGVVLRPANVAALRGSGLVVWLTAPVDTLVERVREGAGRPSLTGRDPADEVDAVLREREPLYRAAAHETVSTDGRMPEEVANAIAALPALAR